MSPVLNLLDWRHQRRQRAQHALRHALQGSLLAALLLLLLAYAALQALGQQHAQRQGRLQERLHQRQQQLQARYAQADRQRQQRRRLQQIEALRRMRELPALWLDALTLSLPATVQWTELQQTPEGLLLTAQTADAASLGAYLQALQHDAVFAQVQLQTLQREPSSGLQRFVLRLQPATLDAGS